MAGNTSLFEKQLLFLIRRVQPEERKGSILFRENTLRIEKAECVSSARETINLVRLHRDSVCE